ASDGAGGLVSTLVNARGASRQAPPESLRVDALGSGDRPGAPGEADDFLLLPRGRSAFAFLECDAARLDAARFNRARFAGGPCFEAGVFGASRFTGGPDAARRDGPVFAGADASQEAAELEVSFPRHRPGAFELVLPADLEPRFGGRFGAARFGAGTDAEAGESYPGVALEPPLDAADHWILSLADSALVEAAPAARAPLGFAPVRAPFRAPQRLTLGDRDRPAALYLEAPGLEGVLEVRAREKGAWGNELAVVARPGGPGLYDIEVLFPGARFENARQLVAGPAPPALAEELLSPSPVGVLEAKAAGISPRVSRRRAELGPPHAP
ncbi:MAG: hypothetical protein AAF725_13260, partial [Acidobacteriota bacterium]